MTTPRFSGRDPVALRKHLASYWKMEGGNVLAVPLFVWFLVWQAGDTPDLAAILAAAACSFLLVVGTAAWRMALARLDGDMALAGRLVAFCARAELPSLALLAAATAATGHAIVTNGWPPRTIAAVGLSLLAWLEYVNYYHWQLQNFDSAIDFKRIMAGRGLRRAHMGRAVKLWRAQQRIRR